MSRARWLLAVLLLVPAGHAGVAQAQSSCQEVPPDCGNDSCSCSPSGNTTGDPIDVSRVSSIFRRIDAEVKGSLEPLKLLRAYDSDTEAWTNSGAGELAYFEPPFGHLLGTNDDLLWWHNWFSYVIDNPAGYYVRTSDGRMKSFSACAPPCWAARAYAASSDPNRLYYSVSGNPEFDYFTPNNEEYIYASGPLDAGYPNLIYFLSSKLTSTGATVATVNYRRPVDSTWPQGAWVNGGNCGDQGGVPYVGSVVNEDGNTLDFRYEWLDGGVSTETGCVLQTVYLESSAFDAGPVVQASYAYANNAPGELSSATVASTPSAYTELYTETPDFSVVTQSGSGLLVNHAYAGQYVSSSTSPDDQMSLERFGQEATTICGGYPAGPVTALSLSATLGDGTSTDGGFTRVFYPQDAPPGINYQITPSYTDACPNDAGCSPGTVTTGWACQSWGQSTYGYPLYVQDKSKNYTITPGQPAGDPTWPWEPAGMERGVPSNDYNGDSIPAAGTCLGADCEWYSWSYDHQKKERLKYTNTRASVAAPGQQATELFAYLYDWDGGNIPTADFKMGYGDGGLVNVASFYWTQCRTNCNGNTGFDPANRVIETHGPCVVNNYLSQDCDAQSPFPITKYAYWPAGSGPATNKLQSVSRYPSGPSSTPLTTTYNDYDIYGNATSVTDPDGYATTYTYANGLLTQKKTGGWYTNYGYDNKKLTWVEHPKPAWYEVFCYRQGGSSSECDTTNGTFTPLLQWKAKCGDPAGSTNCTERVQYSYAGDGTVSKETYQSYVSGGWVTRQIRQYQKDNQRRPTWEAWGQDNGSGSIFQRVHQFDPSDNISGVSPPLPLAQPFCGGAGQAAACPPSDPGSNPSENQSGCQLMSSDCANRLTWIDDFPEAGGTPIQTRVAYDSASNVCAVTVGASTSWQSSCTYTGAADDAKTAYYQHDDFGNVISVAMPDVGANGAKGAVYYGYDALGDVTTKMRPDGTGTALRDPLITQVIETTPELGLLRNQCRRIRG